MAHAWARVLLLLALLPTAARAESEALRKSKAHFEAGRALYGIGNYEDALREFNAGYALVPRPQFLLNLGQTYRKLHKDREALGMYERYLHETTLADDMRPSVEKIVEQLNAAIAAAPSPEPAPIATLGAPSSPPASEAPRRSYRWLWWTVPLIGAAVAGATIGTYFALQPQIDCAGPGYGCLNAP